MQISARTMSACDLGDRAGKLLQGQFAPHTEILSLERRDRWSQGGEQVEWSQNRSLQAGCEQKLLPTLVSALHGWRVPEWLCCGRIWKLPCQMLTCSQVNIVWWQALLGCSSSCPRAAVWGPVEGSSVSLGSSK